MYALKTLSGVLSGEKPRRSGQRGAQARRGLDNAAFIGLPSSGCSAGFYGLVLLLWRCKAPGKPAPPAARSAGALMAKISIQKRQER